MYRYIISGKSVCRKSLNVTVVLVISLSCLYSGTAFSQSSTLAEVRARGWVLCGLADGLKGFAEANSLGDYAGLDADFCRAVSSAIFDDPTRVVFVPLNNAERFDVLASASIDLLARNTTWTMSRNIQYGQFVGVNYYDGQGFMVKKSSGIRSALELDNKGICVVRGTTTELNAIDYFSVVKMRYKPVYLNTNAEADEAYKKDRCAALTTDRSGLAASRASFDRPDAHLVLPEVISKEPLGPLVRPGDTGWENIVRWSLNCMINAEEMGISSKNITKISSNANPAARRLLGMEGKFGELLNIDNQWCANIITHIGNYQETYERNVGVNTALGLLRGVNRLWTDGGLLYAPPIR